MARPLFPSKLISERITLEFNFLDELEWGETIASVAFSVSVSSGIDTDPNAIIFSTPILVANPVSVKQRFHAGVPGVIYEITCAVRGTSGQVYKKNALLAVLPGDAKTPLFFATYLTSTPYPIEQVDSISFGAIPLSGIIDTVIRTYTNMKERASFTSHPLSGILNPNLKTTILRERAAFTNAPQSGVMDVVLITYSLRNAASFGGVPVSASMDVVLLTTTNRERSSFSCVPLSGTMS